MDSKISHLMYIRTIKNLKTKTKTLTKKAKIKIWYLIIDQIRS